MTSFKALLVEQTADNSFQSAIVNRHVDDLPAGDVLIRVKYSSLNYKDALSASGNKGVTRHFPHTPGIDAAGIVETSSDSAFKAGDEVIVIGYDLGMNTAGGFGQYIRVPAGWVVKCPPNMSLRQSMVLGTAGFTAALCVEKLLVNGLTPQSGSVLVTGATGGVGTVAVALLHKLGFHVVASTGKTESHDALRELGANEVIDRSSLSEPSSKPLLPEQWAAAIDVAGGDTLANIIKTVSYGGSVACCGLVQSTALNTTVLPFILRGVNLLGVDSVQLPLKTKAALWHKLADEWQLSNIDAAVREIGFDVLEESLQTVLQGGAVGRFVLNLDS